MARVEYEIIVPSRLRTENMPRLRALLPTATICVDEREEAAYRAVVPGERLVLHPPTRTIGEVRRWIFEHRPAPCLVMVDDDLRAIRCLVGQRQRVITEAQAILRIIENAIDITADLGLALFCWGRIANPMEFRPNDPLSFVAPASNAWGVIGREFAMDGALMRGEDVDLTLQNLLHKRIIFQDRRFYWDCGGIWRGKGGLQGVRTSAEEQRSVERLQRRWGPYIDFGRVKKGGTTGMGIRVRRRSPMISVG